MYAKIAFKALATMVKDVIQNLVNHDQTAYVKDRFIEESIHTVNDLLEYADRENEDGILFAADMEKAFDPVEQEFFFNINEIWL